MRFETAIEHLVDNYRYAKSKVWIRDEVAWALYHTWKEADDRKTEPQTDEFELFDREDLILLIECQKERIAELLAKDEPQTDEEYINNLPWVEVGNGEQTDEPQTEIPEYAEWKEPFEKMTDCPWK